MTTETHPVIPGLTAPIRRWIYGLVLAAVPVAVALGVTDNTTAALILALVAAFLGGGVALPNVTDQPTANTTQPGLFDNNAYGDTGDTGR